MTSTTLPSLPALLAPLNEALMPALQLGFASPLPLTSGIVLTVVSFVAIYFFERAEVGL